MTLAPYRYVKPQSVESPVVGSLNNARAHKAAAFKHLQHVRRMRDNAPALHRTSYSLAILSAESRWKESIQYENRCLVALEEEANRFGLTILTPKQREKREKEAADLQRLRDKLRAEIEAA